MKTAKKSHPRHLCAAALPILLLFGEAGFPRADVKGPMPVIEGARVCVSVEELKGELGKQDRVLVWRHGSTFPVELWPQLQDFLKKGGSLLHLGGAPFTRPVVGKPGERQVQPRTVSYLKALRLNQAHELSAGGATMRWCDADGDSADPSRTLGESARVFVLEPRLSEVRDFTFEDGGSGARDAILRPLYHLRRQAQDRFAFAAAAVQIDRLRGPFGGGRWVLWLCDEPPGETELPRLLARARQAPMDLRVDPGYACYHEGERATVILRMHRPRQRESEPLDIELQLLDASDKALWSRKDLRLEGGQHASLRVSIPVDLSPGLHRLTLRTADRPPFRTGFWVMDEKLFTSGGPITFDDYTMRRGGAAEPVIGTTLMSRSVHRKFLFEPNAAEWDESFAELDSLGINMVRTGVWTAYRKISQDPGVVDEAFLRALEAYYLSARRHGIPVIFTFFAFMPEAFGGVNPYLDPRAVEGQRAYLAQVAQRFRHAKEMLWDLINEPSFSNPDKLWQCRPNGDAFEAAAFVAWLARRYGPGDDNAGGKHEGNGGDKGQAGSANGSVTWKDEVRSRWRLRQDESIGLPLEGDFAERHLMGGNRPYRAREYGRFAQDAFSGWIDELSQAIRQAGSEASITVGQDEGGVVSRPGQLFHHARVDYTSLHSWWFNDNLLWDGIMAKATGKPLLVSETGVMGRERLSGAPHRTMQSSAALLSRKIGYSFAAGSFGVIQWCYDTNPYMDIDNEVSIGLKRVDGSAKPEHAVLVRFAAFFKRNRALFTGRSEPRTVLLVPHAEVFPPRGLGMAASQSVVSAWSRSGAVPLRAVSEYRTSADLGQPEWILLPSCSGISDRAWKDVRRAVRAGATLVCSGWFEQDDSGRPAHRLGSGASPMPSRVLALVEGTQNGTMRFPLEVVQSMRTSTQQAVRTIKLGKGKILHHPHPVDLAESGHGKEVWYYGTRVTAGEAPRRFSDALFLARVRLAKAELVILINEGGSDLQHEISGTAHKVTVPAGETRLLLLGSARKVLDSSH